MSTLSVRLPNSIHKKLRECAEREGTSINQLISTAVGEKLSALLTEEYLAARAARGSRRKFDAVLRRVPKVEPPTFDRLPNQPAKTRRKSRRSGRR
jgi:hypothetical protein